MQNQIIMKRTIILLFTLALVWSATAFLSLEETPFIRMLRSKLLAYNESYPEEKVYVQTDKPFYKPGEDIWFNVSVLNSNSHHPTTISDVVYVELIDPKGNVASKVNLVVVDGTAHGDFSIPETMPGGLYHIQAFTNWMKNFGDKNVFRKEIQVQRIITPRLLLKLDFERESYGSGDVVSAKLTINNLKNERGAHAAIRYSIRLKGADFFNTTIIADENGEATLTCNLPDTLKTSDGLLQAIVEHQGVSESISRSIPIVLNNVSIQFFPEGGYTLANTNSTIAFKALNEFGKGADVSGSIVDQENNRVCSFTSYHMGMGAFDFVPTGNKQYYARIESPAGNDDLIPLPPPRQNGVTIHLLEKAAKELKWKINASKNQVAYLVGQAHGEIYHAEQVSLKSGENIFEVPIKKFPTGIAAFTLFNEDGVAESERLVFVNDHEGLNIKLKPNKEKYEPREKVEVRIETTDNNGKPVSAKLALSVVDDQLISFADDKQDNLLSTMLLSTEVKGEIQEPGFYFDPNEPKANRALDYLLMTQGWRRFTWPEVTHNSRTIVHIPEKVKNLNGRLQDKDGKGVQSEVTLIELSGLKRIIKVQTTKDGVFLFRNIEPTISLLLIANKPWIISVEEHSPTTVSSNLKARTLGSTDVTEVIGNISQVTEVDERGTAQASMNMSMDDDVSALSEVVVVGYGTVERKDLTASVAVVNNNELDGSTASSPIENMLQGRVSGLVVQPQSGNPGAQSTIRIRGFSSLAAGRNEPLYVIDGHPIGSSLNQNFSNGSIISPDDIESIEIMQSPEAAALFGSGAANGVILITTKSRLGYYYDGGYAKPRAPKFSNLVVYPKRFSGTREFYVPEPVRVNDKRQDFRTTVYWNHTVVTNDKGVANVNFYNTDAVSAFRITAEGFSGTGLLGRSETVYYTQLPFSLDTKIPESLGFEDVLKLPVKVKNETASVLNGIIKLNIPAELKVLEALEQHIQVPPHTTHTFWFTITPKGIEGKFPISIKVQSKTFNDEVGEIIQVKPIGFPVRISVSAKAIDQTFMVPIHDAEKNSIQAELVAYPDVLTDLFAGAEAILREPYGCFEQVSSSTFPNILALQFLKQSGQLNSTIEKQANMYIENGYKRLKAYEIKGGGFEWFGHPPAHEGLTAYGLIEFHEMQKVYNGVDEEMMQRTRDWLLSRRNGKGGFRQNSGKYGFSAASEAVANAYITYALSETGTLAIEQEYKNALEEVLESKDMYRMALVASTAYNLNKRADYNMLVSLFKEALKNGFELKASHSIVRSYGMSLKCETLSFWATTLMKESSTELELIQQCIQEILKSRSFGQFGSTQATTMALKALTDYAKWMRATREDGKIFVYINNQLADQMEYNKEDRKNLVLQNFSSRLSTEGVHQLRVLFDQTTAALPYSMNIQWYTKKPITNEDCKVTLSTSLNTNTVKVNETVRLTSTVKNKTAEGLPMIVAVIGIPSGLSVQPWQLKELQEKGDFDFYEIMNGNLIIYYREMSPSAQYIINLDLKAEVPGIYTGTASSAYLYYTNEFKHWVHGNTITIQ